MAGAKTLTRRLKRLRDGDAQGFSNKAPSIHVLKKFICFPPLGASWRAGAPRKKEGRFNVPMSRRPTYYRRAGLKPGATKMSPLDGSYVSKTRADLGFGSDHHSTFGVRRSIFVVGILS